MNLTKTQIGLLRAAGDALEKLEYSLTDDSGKYISEDAEELANTLEGILWEVENIEGRIW